MSEHFSSISENSTLFQESSIVFIAKKYSTHQRHSLSQESYKLLSEKVQSKPFSLETPDIP